MVASFKFWQQQPTSHGGGSGYETKQGRGKQITSN